MGPDREVSLYLQLAERRTYYKGQDLRIVSTTTDPPLKREKETVVVKIRVKVPREAFQPSKAPEAVVTVPLEALSPVSDSIEVEAESPYETAGT